MKAIAAWTLTVALLAAGSVVAAQEAGSPPKGDEKGQGGKKGKEGEKGKDSDRAKLMETVRERVAAKAMEWAKAADGDGNGSLSEAEFGAFLEAARKGEKEIRDAVMSELGIGKKDEEPKDEGKRGKREAENLKKWDTNGDGKLDDAEKEARKAAMEKEKQERLAQAFKKADADSDGSVSFEEAVAFLTSRGGGPGRRGDKEKKAPK